MKIILTFLGLIFFNLLLCQEPIFRNFSFEQGLRTYNIKKVLQDKYGYMWIATQYGVYRYNGKSFEVFTRNGAATGHLSENFIFDIFYTPENDLLYTASFNGGVDIVNVRTLSITHLIGRSQTDRLPNLWIRKLLVDKAANIWIGGEGYLAVYKVSTGQPAMAAKLLLFKNDVNVTCIRQTNDSTVAIAVENTGIICYNTKRLQPVAIIKGVDDVLFADNGVHDMQVAGRYLFVALADRIFRAILTGSKLTVIKKYTPFTGHKRGIISCIASSGDSTIWIGTNAGLACMNIANESCAWMRKEDREEGWLEDNTINDIFFDSGRNLWVSTSKKLQMVKLNPEPFKIFSKSLFGNTRMDHVYSLVPGGKNEIYATATDGLYVVDIASSLIHKVNGTGALGVIHYVLKLENNFFIISSDKGMFLYDPVRKGISRELLLQKYPEWAPFVNRYFNASVSKGNKILWASEEQEGLFTWDIKAHTIVQQKAGGPGGVPENHLHNIKEDHKGNTWLLMDNSVARYNVVSQSVEEVIWCRPENHTFNSGIVFDMFDDGKKLWFGTYSGGLNGYDPVNKTWEYITEKDGLSNNCVYGILPERDSIVWVATNFGISRINYRTHACVNFFKEDGLQNNSFDEKGALKMNDSLFFGGIDGFTMINARDFVYKGGKLPFYIDRVTYEANGRRYVINDIDWKKIALPAETSSIEIHFSSPQYNYNNIRFQYRFMGSGAVFQTANEDNVVRINFLSHGHYEFELRMSDDKGKHFVSAITLPFYINPQWYDTWWIKAIAFIAVISMVYILYRIKLARVLREQRIRQEIAGDLHDDIGSTLNSAKIFAELALHSGAGKEYMANVTNNLSDAILNLRDIIWVLDDKQDTVANLAERLQKFSQPVVTSMNIGFHLDIQTEIQQRLLNKKEKKNFFMILKEACNNSFKYSSCNNIFIHVFDEDKRLKFEFRDDGIGFVPAKDFDGYGLKNMIYRAKSIGYKVEVISSLNNGVLITLTGV